ncbi:MAG: GNAT family N-acetyltransferase [Rhodocyclaceae bacterium]|nr:GNAT family N-acetyltransferase [Rhodocyclaceae bacterium]
MAVHHSPVDALVNPGGVALFGASAQPGTLGYGLAQNLLHSPLAGRLHFINPKYREVAGRASHCHLDELHERVSLALIASPAQSVPDIIAACARRGVQTAVLYCAGFGAHDSEGASQLEKLRAAAAAGGMRLFGPRALGYVLPHSGINATPMARPVPAGNLAFVCQSGAICAGVLDWEHRGLFGFSAVFVPGQAADLDLPELLDYLATDPKSESVLLYLEGVRDARRFLSSVRALAAVKPVIAVKAGRHTLSAPYAGAHLGVEVDRDDVFDAALRRAGVLRVRSVGDMFSAARALTTPRMPRGKRLAVVCNGGGPAVLAADLADEMDVTLEPLSARSADRIASWQPPSWSAANPVDVLFDASPQRYTAALTACLEDAGVDGVLAILAPNTFVDPLALAQAVAARPAPSDKPLLTCWLGEQQVHEARATFAQARIPSFRTPELAVQAFAFMAHWMHNQELLREIASAAAPYPEPRAQQARDLVRRVLADGRHKLAADECRQLLAAFHIGAPAAAPAPAGFPLRVRIVRDRVFGPAIALGEPGPPEAMQDEPWAIALPPLNARLVDALLDAPRVARLLHGLGERAGPLRAALRALVLRAAEMAAELPWLLRLDMLPAGQDDAPAAHAALIEVAPLAAEGARYAHMAICPYPAHLGSTITLKDGSLCSLRPIRPEDALALQEFVQGLSSRSKRYRYFCTVKELPRYQLARATQIDYGRELTLLAWRDGGARPEVIGEANYAVLADGNSCEFAIVTADGCAGQGLGSGLMRRLMDAARAQGLTRMRGEVLLDNEPMLALMDALGFMIKLTDDEHVVEATRLL